MSVITMSKSDEVLRTALHTRGDLPVVVLGCHKCAKISKTGGAADAQARKLASGYGAR